MSFHHSRIQFKHIDPLANGLRDEINAEKSNSDAISLTQDIDSSELIQFWQKTLDEVKNDPQWFKFSD